MGVKCTQTFRPVHLPVHPPQPNLVLGWYDMSLSQHTTWKNPRNHRKAMKRKPKQIVKFLVGFVNRLRFRAGGTADNFHTWIRHTVDGFAPFYHTQNNFIGRTSCDFFFLLFYLYFCSERNMSRELHMMVTISFFLIFWYDLHTYRIGKHLWAAKLHTPHIVYHNFPLKKRFI